jgi:rhodanese-related sulfurtransferase
MACSFSVAQVEGALKLSESDFQEKYQRAKPKPTDEVIFHCKMGGRAGKAADAAAALGFLK